MSGDPGRRRTPDNYPISGSRVCPPRRRLGAVTSTEPTLWEDDDADLVPAIVEPSGGEVAPLAELTERARAYARSSKAANTLRAYESDLRHFGAWCEARGLETFPAEAETVALDLVDHAERLAVSTLRRVWPPSPRLTKRPASRTRPSTRRCG